MYINFCPVYSCQCHKTCILLGWPNSLCYGCSTALNLPVLSFVQSPESPPATHPPPNPESPPATHPPPNPESPPATHPPPNPESPPATHPPPSPESSLPPSQTPRERLLLMITWTTLSHHYHRQCLP